MTRPTMDRHKRIRVEFGLSPELAERVYDYAHRHGMSLSKTGEHLLVQALSGAVDLTGRSSTRCVDTVCPAID